LAESYFNAKVEKLPRAELEDIQAKRFRETVLRAFKNSGLYSRMMKQHNIDPAKIRTLADLQRLRFFTTKDDIRDSFPYGALAVPRNRVVEMHASSGTSGIPTVGFHTSKDIDDWGEISARSLIMAGMTRNEVFQITPSLGMFSGGFGFYHGARKVGCTIVPASAGLTRRQIQLMRDFGTTMISAVVSYSFRLAEVAKEMGVEPRTQTKVRKGIFGSEIWTGESREKLAQMWDMDPYDVYGFSEMYGPGMGNDCHLHEGIHMWEDFFLVEVVDPKSGEPVGKEEEGELVITTLAKEAMPLLRYRSRDISKMIDALECDCGRTHRRFSRIIGRTDDMVKVSGVSFWPSEVEAVLMKRSDVGTEYKITLTRRDYVDHFKVEVESSRRLRSGERVKLADELSTALGNILLFKPEVVVVEPGTLPRVEVGKAQRMFDERKQGAIAAG